MAGGGLSGGTAGRSEEHRGAAPRPPLEEGAAEVVPPPGPSPRGGERGKGSSSRAVLRSASKAPPAPPTPAPPPASGLKDGQAQTEVEASPAGCPGARKRKVCAVYSSSDTSADEGEGSEPSAAPQGFPRPAGCPPLPALAGWGNPTGAACSLEGEKAVWRAIFGEPERCLDGDRATEGPATALAERGEASRSPRARDLGSACAAPQGPPLSAGAPPAPPAADEGWPTGAASALGGTAAEAVPSGRAGVHRRLFQSRRRRRRARRRKAERLRRASGGRRGPGRVDRGPARLGVRAAPQGFPQSAGTRRALLDADGGRPTGVASAPVAGVAGWQTDEAVPPGHHPAGVRNWPPSCHCSLVLLLWPPWGSGTLWPFLAALVGPRVGPAELATWRSTSPPAWAPTLARGPNRTPDLCRRRPGRTPRSAGGLRMPPRSRMRTPGVGCRRRRRWPLGRVWPPRGPWARGATAASPDGPCAGPAASSTRRPTSPPKRPGSERRPRQAVDVRWLPGSMAAPLRGCPPETGRIASRGVLRRAGLTTRARGPPGQAGRFRPPLIRTRVRVVLLACRLRATPLVRGPVRGPRSWCLGCREPPPRPPTSPLPLPLLPPPPPRPAPRRRPGLPPWLLSRA